VSPPARAALPSDPIAAFRRRDPDGVRAFYQQYGRQVYAVAWRILGRADLAEKASRETFVRAWQASTHVDPGADPAMWLATITETVAREFAWREPDVPNAPEPRELSQVWAMLSSNLDRDAPIKSSRCGSPTPRSHDDAAVGTACTALLHCRSTRGGLRN